MVILKVEGILLFNINSAFAVPSIAKFSAGGFITDEI